MNVKKQEKTIWPIEKLATCSEEIWANCDKPNIYIQLDLYMLYFIAEGTIIKALNLTQQVKGFINENIIFFTYENEGTLKKIKFKFNWSKDELNIFANKILQYVHIQIVTQTNIENMCHPTLNFKEMIKAELSRPTNYNVLGDMFPSEFDFEEFLKSCIMDPAFPDMVDKVEKSLHKYLY